MPAYRYLPAIGVLALLGASWYVLRTFVFVDAVSPHIGHGRFEDISRRYFVFAIPGYRILFPEIDLGHSVECTYQLKNMPNIGQHSSLILVVDQRSQALSADRRDLKSMVNVVLLDSGHKTVACLKGGLGDFVSGHWDLAERLYQTPGSSFDPNPSANYTLVLKYHGDPTLAGVKAYLCIESGGHP